MDWHQKKIIAPVITSKTAWLPFYGGHMYAAEDS